MDKSFSQSYARAGVDITAGYRAVELMREHVKRTEIPGVVGGIGGFGGLFQPDLSGLAQPVLVSGADGVGTKLRVAQLLGRHDTVGVDCVAMCVNDVVCCGARPLFFLDYIAIGKNRPEKVAALVSGVAEGCVQAGCALIGGETAEHPGVMAEDDYDLAGFTVGVVDRSKALDPARVKAGDVLVGLPSSGLHSNGFSLARQVLDVERSDLGAPLPELHGAALGETLLTPTRVYVKAVLALLDARVEVHGACHITGGGFFENIPRMLPPGLTARLRLAEIPRPPIFDLIQRRGDIPEREMYNTFNMGLGMALALPEAEADKALDLLALMGESPRLVGDVVPGDGGVELLP